MSTIVSKRYAKSIFDLSIDQKKTDQINEDFIKLDTLLDECADFNRFVLDPIIPPKKRETILEEMFSEKLDPLTTNFLYLLSSKNRLNLLKSICQNFNKLFFKHNNIQKIKITSSEPISSKQLNTLIATWEKKLNKKIEPSTYVDQSLLGGIKIQIEDKIIDYSIQTQLDTFYNNTIKS